MSGPVVITGGGTAGHVFPMRAIAEGLSHRGVSELDIKFVGSRRGQERTLLADRSSELVLLPGRGFLRSLRVSDLLVNVKSLIEVASSCLRMLYSIRRWQPGVVVSVGGYASFPASLAAVVWRIPLVIVNFDAVSGLAHRMLSRFASVTCVAFESTTHRTRTKLTGTPLRESIVSIDRSRENRERVSAQLDPPIEPDHLVIVVMTGSLGSHRVNRAIVDLAHMWAERTDITIVHVTGKRDYSEVVRDAPRGTLDYRVFDFADMSLWWSLCDVAVCRAGAVTIAELATLGIPAVLVPLPGAPGDHQGYNARALVEVGAAVMINDADCTAETLKGTLEDLTDAATRAEMSRRLFPLGRRDAADRIADEVLRVRRAQ